MNWIFLCNLAPRLCSDLTVSMKLTLSIVFNTATLKPSLVLVIPSPLSCYFFFSFRSQCLLIVPYNLFLIMFIVSLLQEGRLFLLLSVVLLLARTVPST